MKSFLLSITLLASGVASAQPLFEPAGPSSRRTPIAISEIMFKPADRVDGRNTEFIELYNSNPWPEDVSRYRLSGQVDYVFPAATSIPSQGYIVIAADPTDMQVVYGSPTVFGPYTNSFKTSGSVRLHDEQDSILLEVDYDNIAPWPMGADGTGHSIVLARASYGEADPRAWERSELTGGSPGAADVLQTNALRNVVINEVLAHTDPPLVDTIELYNHSNVGVFIGGCTLSDDPTTNKYTIPGMTIPARGFVSFTETQLGFGLDAAGETIYFKNPTGTQVLDALHFEAQENGVSLGRYPNGANDWYRLITRTLGTSNTPPRVSNIGFNEIMYHPLAGGDDRQYVELYNRGSTNVDLSGWKLGGGVSFTFPTNCVLRTNSYLVVGRNVSSLLTNYPQLNATNAYGNFSGRLSGSGERITLTIPDTIISTNGSGVVSTNLVAIIVDEVTYGSGGRWGRWSDGGGSSLELIDARSNKRLASNWADSDETAKAPWTTVQTIGVPDNGSGSYSPLQIGLLDAGECLVDDVEVINSSGVSCVGNGGFENGMNSLAFIGSHSRSSLETNSGFGGSVALRVRTADSIAMGPNNVTLALTNTTFASGQNATLRFKARWQRGCAEPLLRFWGAYLEATARLTVPANLGSPGLPNSQARTNIGPAMYQIRHDPAVPAANQSVVVTARVADPDGLSSLTLRYRFDPTTTTTNLAMNDAGTGGDAIANDGIYSATLPGRPTNVIAFVLIATDSTGATNRFPELIADNAPVRECVVFFGEPNPTNLFGTYHLWLTQTNVNRWNALPKMSNEDIDGTLVYNGRVIYNMGGRYSGSPWHSPSYDGPAGNKACHYVWSMPKDDLLLGYSSFNKIHWPGNDIQNDTITSVLNDPTLQREQAANMFLREVEVPWMNRRLVAVYVNGTRRGKLMEDACRPTAGGVQDQYFSDDEEGQLYKIQRWYEGSGTGLISDCRLQHYYTTALAKKTARYRPIWALKDSPDSLSDFTNLYTLITATTAYAQPSYVDFIENVVDVENWMRVSAANHAAGNWDCFGVDSGQNADAWVSANHRWILFTIDFGICLDNNLATAGLTGFGDGAWSQMYSKPKFQRMYYRALSELANGIMQSSVINPILDAKYAAITAAGISATAPTATKSWIANRRNSIISLLASANAAPFALGTNVFHTTTNSVTLTGTAPIAIVSISINGVTYTPAWTSLTAWSLTVPMTAGTFNWTVEARDRAGNLVGGAFAVSATNSGVAESPVSNVVFNEIMFNPATPGAEFIELFNRSTNTSFDLSGWQVNGLDYTFPPGSTLPPQKYLVLAKSSVVFASAYSALVPVSDTFSGDLQTDGETLSLIKPGLTPELDVVVDRVRYETTAPWPATPGTQPGTALQLVDATKDNGRVANWSSSTITRSTPGASNSVAATLPEFPALWLNEVQAENLTGPLDNFSQLEPWLELYNPGTNTINLNGFYLGTNYSNLTNWAFPAGASIAPGQFLVVWLDGQPAQTAGSILHTSFRLNPAGGNIALSRLVSGSPQIVDYLNYQPLPANYSYGDFPDGQPFYREPMFHPTPAGTNNAIAAPITIRINEWMAENTSFLFNAATARYDDWFELFNPSTNTANLTGYYLTDNLSNPFQYQIPAGYNVPTNGFLFVWADSETSANSTNSPILHVPFKLSKDGEAIGLFAPDGTLIDAVTFTTQTANISEGRIPDAGSLRLFLPTPSPSSPNILPPATQTPTITTFSNQGDGTFRLEFPTEAGHTYRVEYKFNLTDPIWLPLGADHFAPTPTLLVTDNPGDSQRFYRIRRIQ